MEHFQSLFVAWMVVWAVFAVVMCSTTTFRPA